MTEPTIAELAGSYSLAWADHDADAIAALHTEDSVFHVHGLGKPAAGRDAVRALAANLLALVPDLKFEPTRVNAGAAHLVFEYEMSGTAGSSWFVCDGVDVISVNAGLVARKDTYLDLVALEQQIGALHQMDVSATPPRP